MRALLSTVGPERHVAKVASVVAVLVLGACVPSGHLKSRQAPAPVFDPIAFFAGHTEGRGRIKIVLKRPQGTLVEGHGAVSADGTIDLNQIVRRGTTPPTRRSWHLYRIAPGHYTGTLSDAQGPVIGDVTGNTLHLKFEMKSGLRAQQWLYLQPGGQSALNRMVITKFGIPVASLDETITRSSN